MYVDIIRKYVLEAFNQIAEGYSHWRSRPWRDIKKIILENFRRGLILDIGCGNGRHSYFLLRRSINVIGVDIAINMLKKYLENRDGFEKTFLNLVNADGRMLPFRDNVFNGIICIAVLHNIPGRKNREKFLRECKRVLHHGGKIILTVWTLFQPKFLFKAFLHKLLHKGEIGDIYVPWRKRGRKIYRFYHLYRGEELRKDLERAGFTTYLFQKHDHRMFLKRNYLVIALSGSSRGTGTCT